LADLSDEIARGAKSAVHFSSCSNYALSAKRNCSLLIKYIIFYDRNFFNSPLPHKKLAYAFVMYYNKPDDI
jgi:hypothetical protein